MKKPVKLKTGAAWHLKRFLLMSALSAAFALPLDAEIIFRTQTYNPQSRNPAPSAAQMAGVKQASTFW
jgi:hypothetical protein